MKRLNIFAAVRILLFAALLFIFALIPTEVLKDTSFCIGYILAGRLCPGCGGTRALNCLMHLDFRAAFLYNPIVALFMFPASLILFASDIYAFVYRIVKKKEKLSLLEYYFTDAFLTGRR